MDEETREHLEFILKLSHWEAIEEFLDDQTKLPEERIRFLIRIKTELHRCLYHKDYPALPEELSERLFDVLPLVEYELIQTVISANKKSQGYNLKGILGITNYDKLFTELINARLIEEIDLRQRSYFRMIEESFRIGDSNNKPGIYKFLGALKKIVYPYLKHSKYKNKLTAAVIAEAFCNEFNVSISNDYFEPGKENQILSYYHEILAKTNLSEKFPPIAQDLK